MRTDKPRLLRDRLTVRRHCCGDVALRLQSEAERVSGQRKMRL